jgi:arylsulfatase A-like enzyme
MKYTFLVFLGIFLITSCTKKEPQPNFVIFYSDELDPEYISLYGESFRTPNIDKLGSEGIKFTNAYVAAPMCTPSRFALLTGKYPGRCVHKDFLEAYPKEEPYVIAWNTYLEGSLPSIASVLSDNGYFTGMAGKWHIGKLPENVHVPVLKKDADLDDPNVDAQLKKYQNIVSEQVRKDAGFDFTSSVLWGNFDNFPILSLRTHNFPWITKGAISFLEEASKKDQPFFLYVASTAVHGPGHAEAFNKDLRYTLEGKIDDLLKYQLPADSMREAISAQEPRLRHKYAGMACLDHHIKMVANKLTELGLNDNTIIIFMADHNVEPGKATCYEKGLKVPLILKLPEGQYRGVTSKKLVSNVDIFPTMLESANIPIPEGLLLDGISILPGIRSQNIQPRPYVFAESGLARSVSDGSWKYISFRYPEKDLASMKNGEIDYAPNYLNMEKQAHSSIAMEKFPAYFDADQLFNLEEDPYELNNLAYDPSWEAELNRLQNVLADHVSTFDHAYPLADTSFMRTEEYKELVEKSRSYGTDYIPWLRRDHGYIQWPPVK